MYCASCKWKKLFLHTLRNRPHLLVDILLNVAIALDAISRWLWGILWIFPQRVCLEVHCSPWYMVRELGLPGYRGLVLHRMCRKVKTKVGLRLWLCCLLLAEEDH